MEQRNRFYRELDAEPKQKLSKSTIGKSKSASHKEHISQAMKRYWAGIPNTPQHTTMADLLGIDD